MSKRRPDKRLTTIRNAVIAGAAVVIALVLGYGLWRSTAVDVSGEFVEGSQYKVIKDAPPVPLTGPIRVTEFFSYGCVHCRNFDSIVEDWLSSKPDDVLFERSPVSFAQDWNLLGQAYFALQSTNALAENHERLFKAIHDNGRQLHTPQSLADFVDGHGVARDAFLLAFNSPATERAAAEALRRERAARVNGVPSLTVADHYAVNMDSVPRKKAFDVVDFLVAKVRAERTAREAGAPAQ